MMRFELLKAGSIYKTASSKLRWILFALFSLAWTTSPLQAAVYYVSLSGNDSNPGSQSKPFRTVRKGISLLKPSDTLYVRGGNYGEMIGSAYQTMPAGTSWSSPITIAAYPGEVVTLRRIALYTSLPHQPNASLIRYLIFQGFVVDAPGLTEAIFLSDGANHIRFRDCEIKRATNHAVLVSYRTGATNFNEFINLNVHDNGSHAFYIETSYNLVEFCDVYANGRYGIHIYNGYAGQRADGNVVRRNLVHDNSTLGTGGGIIASSGSDNLVCNNVVWNHRNYGIDVSWRNPSNNKIYHNTVCKNAAGINIGPDSKGTLVRNNIAYYNPAAIQDRGISTALWNNLTSDPSFADFNSNDYRLRSGSRAINAGILLSEVLLDILGVSRPQGSGVDIGAYEYK